MTSETSVRISDDSSSELISTFPDVILTEVDTGMPCAEGPPEKAPMGSYTCRCLSWFLTKSTSLNICNDAVHKILLLHLLRQVGSSHTFAYIFKLHRPLEWSYTQPQCHNTLHINCTFLHLEHLRLLHQIFAVIVPQILWRCTYVVDAAIVQH